MFPDARVAVIGAGPAGSFFAHILLIESIRRGLYPIVTIFDSKDFETAGRRNCNMCAGTLSGWLVDELEAEGYRFPHQVVQTHIHGYVVHSRDRQARLAQRPDARIYTVFRGVPFPELTHERGSFDQFLLDHAIAMGARYIRSSVKGIDLPASPGEPIRIRHCQPADSVHEADLVVGAFGVNSPLAKQFLPGYKVPKVWRAFQGEILVGRDLIASRYGDHVHIFLGDGQRIKFLALTPKRFHVTLTAIGPNVKRLDVAARLRESDTAPFLPEDWKFRCHCHPAFPVSSAEKPYGDRVVVIGDACISRYLKNGIESAWYTALFAVQTILDHGFSEADFRAHYFRACRRKYERDNRFGRLIFGLNDLFCRLPILANAHIEAVRHEQAFERPKDRRHSQVLWDVFTGDRSYARIFLSCCHPMLHARTGWETARELWRRLRNGMGRP
jgi:flavin-dependent dehydrogenase